MYEKNNKVNKNLYKSGRYALYYGLSKVLKHKVKLKKILLPNFICEEVIKPLQRLDLNIDFYHVNRDLNINIEEIVNKNIKDSTIFFVVNYFGFPADWSSINSLKKDLNLFVVEDNAHSAFTKYKNKRLGDQGDLSFNSLRKFLPILGGSELMTDYSNETIYQKQVSRMPSLEELKYSLRHLKPSILKNKKNNGVADDSFNLKLSSIDWISNILLNKNSFDENKIAESRINNYKFWEKYLHDWDVKLFDHLKINNDICPYAFPCITKNNDQTKKIIEWGKKKNINIIKWPKFPHHERFIYPENDLQNVILFPVNHQYDLNKIL